MEYIQGEPLSGILNRNTRGLPEAQAREWFLQTASAVAYLHDHAVVHRDIKPANIFVENGIVKLGDYGLSKSVGASQHANRATSAPSTTWLRKSPAAPIRSRSISTLAA
jgi:serine/threonine protein kinase